MNDKKRILLTSPSGLNNGGVQHIIMTIVRNLSHMYSFDVLTFCPDDNYYSKEFLSYGGSILSFEKKIKKNRFIRVIYEFFFYFAFKHFLSMIFSKNNYYALHCNSSYISAFILLAAKKHCVNHRFCHSHGTYPNTNLLREMIRNRFRRMIINNSTALIGCSEVACSTFYGIGKGFIVLNNPYDESTIVYSSKTPKALTLLQIGLFCRNKNQTYTVKVFYHIKKKIPNSILRFVGSGESTDLHSLISDLDLNDSVVFHKHDDDKMRLFDNSSYLIMPSFLEGFPITLIEAQAAGLYCFASDTISKETNKGGVNFFSLNDDPSILANKIVNFYYLQKGKKGLFDCSCYKTEAFISNISHIYE